MLKLLPKKGCVYCGSQEVGGTVIGEDGLIVMPGTESTDCYPTRQTRGWPCVWYHSIHSIPAITMSLPPRSSLLWCRCCVWYCNTCFQASTMLSDHPFWFISKVLCVGQDICDMRHVLMGVCHHVTLLILLPAHEGWGDCRTYSMWRGLPNSFFLHWHTAQM